MPKKQNFGFKPGARLEQVDYEHSNSMKDRKHASHDGTILPGNANPGRIEFSERTGQKIVSALPQ